MKPLAPAIHTARRTDHCYVLRLGSRKGSKGSIDLTKHLEGNCEVQPCLSAYQIPLLRQCGQGWCSQCDHFLRIIGCETYCAAAQGVDLAAQLPRVLGTLCHLADQQLGLIERFRDGL